MIDGAEVSVVVQGPVVGGPSDAPERRRTQLALASVRAAYPACEIVFSTWKGAQTGGLIYDRLVLNDDPGAVSQNDTTLRDVFNNLNRQIVSTRNGLAATTRRHAIKLRSDCMLERSFDFDQLDNARRAPPWCLLERPVATLTVYTRHPLRRPVLFHVSDLFQAGLASDLRAIWSAPLVEEPLFTRHIDPRNRPAIDAYPDFDYRMRCAPEQYLAEQMARRLAPMLALRHMADGEVTELFLWLRILANNFRLLSPAKAGIRLPPRMAGHDHLWDLFQSADSDWLAKWTLPRVAWFVRLKAAKQFLEVRYRATPGHWTQGKPARVRWALALARAFVATVHSRELAAPGSSPST